jgi:valyl-tRNA synthetase
VEATKGRLLQPGDDREVARSVLTHVFDQALRLLHPAMPFITESLWRRLPAWTSGTFLATSAWPSVTASRAGDDAFDTARQVITGIRQLRSDYSIPPGQQLTAYVVASDAAQSALVHGESAFIGRLARCTLSAGAAPSGAAAHAVLANGVELVLPLEGVVDLDKEVAKLRGERENLDKQLAALRARLANEKFTAKAPSELVEAERAKEREWTARRDQLDAKVRSLGGA